MRGELRSQAGSLNSIMSNSREHHWACICPSVIHRGMGEGQGMGSNRGKNCYLWELWALHEVLCLQPLEPCLANMCPINTTTVIIVISGICRVTTSFLWLYFIDRVPGGYFRHRFLFSGLCHRQVASHFRIFGFWSGRGVSHASFKFLFQSALCWVTKPRS